MTILAVAAGFLLGGFARWAVVGTMIARVGTGFPWGTALVNLTGCLAIGAIDGLSQGRMGLSPGQRAALMTGFCGSYTTFSALILETSGLLSAGRWGSAALHYVGGGLAALLLFRLGTALTVRL